MFNWLVPHSRNLLFCGSFSSEYFEFTVHRSCFWDHCVILQAPLSQVCVSLIFIPSMSKLGPIYNKYLIIPNQISNKVDLGGVAILVETRRDGDGNERIEKSFNSRKLQL